MQKPQQRIALVYFITASLWILVSDTVLFSLGIDETLIPSLNMFKGIAFVIATTSILYLHLHREFNQRFQLESQLQQQIQHLNQSHELVAQSEARFRKAVEEAPLPISIFAEDGEILSFSQTVLDITGYTADQLQTLDSWTELAYGDRKHIVREAIDSLFDRNQRVDEGEFRINCADGNQRIWEFSSTPLGQLPDGRRIVISMAFDVTERNKSQQALQRLANIFQYTETGIAISYPESEDLELINPAFAQMYGYTVEELTGQPIASVFAPPDRPKLMEAIRLSHENGHYIYEAQHIHKDGHMFPTFIDITVVKDEAGQVQYRIVNVLDISELKRLQDEVNQKNQFLDVLIQASPSGIVVFNPEGIVQLWNPAMEEVMGWSQDETVGNQLPYIREQDRADFDQLRQRVANGETIRALDVQRQRKDRSIVELNISAGPLYDAQGTFMGVVGIVKDVTERKDQEKELRLLWHAINQSANSIMITDAEGHIEYVNPYFTELTGYELEEVIGQNPRFLKSGYTSADQYAGLWQAITSGREWSGEFQNQKKNGEPYWERATISPIMGESGQILHFIGIKEDITQRKRVEDALRTSEMRFRTLVNSMEDIVFTLDNEGRHTGVYGRWLEKYGLTPDMFIGKTSREIQGDASGQVHEVANARALAGQSVNYEWTNGEQTIQTSLSPLQYDDGEIVGIVGIGRDISQLKQTENHLREAQDFAQSTVDALSALIAILDEHGVILAVNRAWNQFAEQNDADAEAVGTGVNYITVLQAVDPTSEAGPVAQAVLSGIQQIMQGEISDFSLEYPCHSPEENRWFMVRITRFENDNPKRIVVAHENVTERVLAGQIIAADKTRLEQLVSERTVQLQRLNTRINIILNNVSNPILLVDVDGKIDVTNPAFNHRLGYQPDELFGQNLWSIFDKGSRSALMEQWRTLDEETATTPMQVQLLAKNGTSFDVEVSLNIVPDNGGHVVCTLYDISHLKEVERMKDEFVSMVSHELRNPIASILMSTDTMRKYYDRLSDDQKKRKLDQILKQGHRLTELVTSILDMSRLEARKDERGDDLVDVAQVLNNVLDDLADQINTKQQKLHVDIVNSSLSLRGEQSDMIRVWQNLLTNAVKYTDDGGKISVRLYGASDQSENLLSDLSDFADSLPADLHSGNYIVGLVEDNGHGIRPEDLPHLFTRFYRGWAASTSIIGTGLGLSLTRDILQLYGGDIAVSSRLDSGTTFCFWLPNNE